ncbi:MAG: GNAT family N-acetyltransferase [Nocardioidaceae bacterium]
MTTEVGSSSHESPSSHDGPDGPVATHASVVVGVDGSERNHAAVLWARKEAEDTGRPLVLVGSSHDYLPRPSVDYKIEYFENETRKMLEQVRRDLEGQVEDIAIWVGTGGPGRVLLQAAERVDLLVVGKRGMGAVSRMLVGSNSMAVAGRSPVPVVIVPDRWVQTVKASAPVVVGIDCTGRDTAVLEFAFDRADRLKVPLVAVYTWQLPALYTWSPQDIDLWTARAEAQLAEQLQPWFARYPSVETVKQTPQANPAMALLDAGEIGQLVVLGRHSGPTTSAACRSVPPHAGSCTTPSVPSSSCQLARRSKPPPPCNMVTSPRHCPRDLSTEIRDLTQATDLVRRLPALGAAMTLRPPEPQSAPAAELYNADVLLADGRIAQIRAVRPEDCQSLEGLHDRADNDNIYSRFFSMNRVLARQFVQRVCQPDSPVRALLASVGGLVVGLVSAEGIGDGQAEVSVFVDDQLHGCGLGTLLLEHLAGWQRGNEIDTLVAEVLVTNSPMLRVFRDAGFGVAMNSESTVCTLTVSINPTKTLFDAVDRRERGAEQASLRHVLEPRSIAVVGVSSSRGGVGRELLENIRSSGFAGRLYAIGRHRLRIDGVTACERLSDLTEPADLIVVAVPAADALTVVREAAAVHAKGCVVISSGFSEAGDHGRELQTRMLAAARSGGMRLIGPNCFGLISQVRDTRLNATFSTLTPNPGNLAIASQSGGVGIAALDEAATSGLGVASFVSLGNKADVSSNDLIAAWTDDPDIEVGALYLESFGNPRKFARLARRFSEQKPLLAVFGGSSVSGHRAGVSHTAASASSSASVRALFDAAGVVGRLQHHGACRHRSCAPEPTAAGRPPARDSRQCRWHRRTRC